MLLSGAAANTGSAAVAAAALQYIAVAASLAGSGILAINLDPDFKPMDCWTGPFNLFLLST